MNVKFRDPILKLEKFEDQTETVIKVEDRGEICPLGKHSSKNLNLIKIWQCTGGKQLHGYTCASWKGA